VTSDPLEQTVGPAGLPDLSESARLVALAQGGDEAALDDLITRYLDRLRRIVRIRMGSGLAARMEVDDVVQETMLMASQEIGGLQVRSQASILQWLSKIALNRIRDANKYFGAAKRAAPTVPLRGGDGCDSSAGGVDPAADETRPGERVERDEVTRILDEAVARLADDDREVVLRRDYEGADWDEIAEQLGRTPGATRKLHQRAWIRLRRIARPRLEGRA